MWTWFVLLFSCLVCVADGPKLNITHSNGTIYVPVDIPAFHYVRFERRILPSTNWLAASYAEDAAFDREVIFSEVMFTNMAWYRVVILPVWYFFLDNDFYE